MLLPLDQSKYFLDSYMQLICRITGDEPSTPKEWARSRDKMLDVIRSNKVWLITDFGKEVPMHLSILLFLAWGLGAAMSAPMQRLN